MNIISKDIQKAISLLENEEVVAIPTETVYGLAGNIFSKKAINRIFETKKRPFFNPLIVHIPSVDQLETIVAEVPETEIKRIINNQNVEIALVTGEVIKGKLTFVSKSASTSTRTFRVEAKVSNASGNIRDGITGTMTIQTNKVLANKISPSILLLSDEGDLGVRVVDGNDEVKFLPIKILNIKFVI